MTRLLIAYLVHNYDIQLFRSQRIKLSDIKKIRSTLRDLNKEVPDIKGMQDTVDSFREQYMLERIKYAKANGYVLVGMGEHHRNNLAGEFNLLGVNHIFMENLLEYYQKEQEKREIIALRNRLNRNFLWNETGFRHISGPGSFQVNSWF